ncbi:unnamed protein product [[Candida] boidinii]|uniref:Altered inheritance of mitochondria protein 6 n=1 Tax=Candida boidinii TaxID=5477 RepID=A0A9W6SVY9_CANBO|nr:hypothetical protein BVG19_g1118 [[Candida] boidinii]OWB50136.1 hypothetical protein B5S27_g1683 [[Candida] boidinii]OWB64874.1 hypothetical protein B5S30_g195 [[Candida] boidinii]OWB81474.1 hypothetical protein B5S33_g91 [[Candida] boidinii]GME68122.1 unnamed protein product [[Candida] boidinii]
MASNEQSQSFLPKVGSTNERNDDHIELEIGINSNAKKGFSSAFTLDKKDNGVSSSFTSDLHSSCNHESGQCHIYQDADSNNLVAASTSKIQNINGNKNTDVESARFNNDIDNDNSRNRKNSLSLFSNGYNNLMHNLKDDDENPIKKFFKNFNIHSNINTIIISLILIFVLIIHVKLINIQNSVSDPSYLSNNGLSLVSLTKGVTVKQIHSHNDEWRKVPLFDALKAGAYSIEADAYYFPVHKDSIFVGHNKNYLSIDKNLDSMYLNHLLVLLEQANSETITSINESEEKNGLFYNSPESTTYFYIDIKNNNIELTKALEKKLKKFISKDYLSYYDLESKKFVQGPLTIIITGDYPYDYIVNTPTKRRYLFIDAPLKDFKDPEILNKFNKDYISIFSSASLHDLTGYYSPINYFTGLSLEQLNSIKEFIKISHENNILTRIWDTPNWPVAVRNKIWKQVLELGSDCLNVDDLKSSVNLF